MQVDTNHTEQQFYEKFAFNYLKSLSINNVI